MTNHVTYTIEMIPANAEKIDKINRILIGGYNAPASEPETKPTQEVEQVETKPVTTTPDEQGDDGEAKFAKFKRLADKYRKEYSEQFCIEVLKNHEVSVGASLMRALVKVNPLSYKSVVESWKAGPVEEGEFEEVADEKDLMDEVIEETPEEDDLDLDLDLDLDDEGIEAEVSPDAVKKSLMAHSKLNGRDATMTIMKSFGMKSLGDLKSSKFSDNPKKLAEIFNAAQ